MAYNTKYQCHFSTLLSENYELFFDFKDYIGNSSELTVIDVSERSVAGDQDRLFPILGKELLISLKIGVGDQADISDLIAMHDNDIRVTLNLIHADGSTSMVFQGFVVVEDNNQPLLDKPFNLQIRALDGLGRLKGVDLVDQSGNVFNGAMTVIEWIANILYKTNQTLPIRIYFNFFPVNLLEQDCFDLVALNARTFQKAENPPTTDPSVDLAALNEDDCYTALEKIIRNFRCKIFMEDGRWNVVHLWEYMNPAGYGYTEYSILDPVSGICPVAITMRQSGLNYDVQAGKYKLVYPFKSDAVLYLKLATKWVKLTYNYDQSQNKVCNQDLTQGLITNTYNEDISSAIIDPTIVPVVILHTFSYDLFCYTHLNGGGTLANANAYPSSPFDQPAFVRRVLDGLGYEIYRFAVLKTTSINNTVTYFRTSRFQIDQNDVLQISFDWRTRISVTNLDSICFAYLYGEDGSFWALRSVNDGSIPGNPNVWQSVDSNFQQGSGGSPAILSSYGSNSVSWNNAGVNQNASTFTAVPVSGDVEILFTAYYGNLTDPQEYWYRNIKISIVPFLLGSLQQLKGDYNFSEIADNIKQTQDDNVEISDSPKRYFKGALLENDLHSLLVPDWHRKGVGENFRFTQGQERLMWNLLRRIVYKIEGTFKGHLYQDSDLNYHPAGFINTYYFVDTDFPSKKFICTSYDRSITEGNGRHVFVEVVEDQNSDPFIDPSVSPNTYKFDYIFQ